MHLGLIGAFPFPYPQGSQVFAGQQARALTRAGAEVSLLSYGSGDGTTPEGVTLHQLPRAISPQVLRSGPQWGKPLADAALVALLLRVHRRTPFDAVLAHHAEAAYVGLFARALTRVPVVYVVHTLLRHELSAYGSERRRSRLDALGARIDRSLATRCNASIALCPYARDALAPYARGPIEVLPPGLERCASPSEEAQIETCATHGVERGRFFAYAGNLDSYQDLHLLADAAAGRGEGAWPVVVVTHDAGAPAERHPALRYAEVASFESLRALCSAAAGLVLTRRRPGGFPIKLLNYMEAGRPIIAWERIAPGLVDGVSARLLPESAGADELRAVLVEVQRDPGAHEALAREARRHLEGNHRWERIAAATLALAGEQCAKSR